MASGNPEPVDDRGRPPRGFCISIDVERDYRSDSALRTRGITDGLPAFLDVLRSYGIPYDLMVSGEVVDAIPEDVIARRDRVALGCHAYSHRPGYMNRMDRAAQDASIRRSTERIAARFQRAPIHFRAPNFSANGDTVRVMQGLGYRVDSSILPGRLVKRWRLATLVDHRQLPRDPYPVDAASYPRPGRPSILEVPVTASPAVAGSPFGLGYLNAEGLARYVRDLRGAPDRYVVFLAHTWEMVDWEAGDRIAPWVREVSSSRHSSFVELLSSLDGRTPMNLDDILQATHV